jgi:hypothetical protein
MTLNIDLKSIAKSAVKKAVGGLVTVELLEIFPAEKASHKKSAEEGTLKVRLPELGLELRNVIYRIHKNKHVVILAPSNTFTRRKGKKEKTSTIDSFMFTKETLRNSFVEELRKQVIEDYKRRQEEG